MVQDVSTHLYLKILCLYQIFFSCVNEVYKQPKETQYMQDNFKPNFTYQDFGRDFTAELFNATEWSILLKNSGAR